MNAVVHKKRARTHQVTERNQIPVGIGVRHLFGNELIPFAIEKEEGSIWNVQESKEVAFEGSNAPGGHQRVLGPRKPWLPLSLVAPVPPSNWFHIPQTG